MSLNRNLTNSTNNLAFYPHEIAEVVTEFRKTTQVIHSKMTGHIGVAVQEHTNYESSLKESFDILGILPPLYPEWLGNRSFNKTHSTRFPYIGGAMANGITTTKMVIALADAGMIGFFGAAGLPIYHVETAVDELKQALDSTGLPWGSNLIYSPEEPVLEEKVADLYIRKEVRRVSASAYTQLTPAVVRYACSGLHIDANGIIQRKNYLFAKISRPEVAELFMSPAPPAILDGLLQRNLLTTTEAELAKRIPLAEDITVEADSGGHTDRQALTVIFPIISLLGEHLVKRFGFERLFRVGAAGGLGDPHAVASAFSLGADYVLTGSVNQACIESGLHESGRRLLALAQIGDVTMTPASDMFEIGVKLQVLKKGTMYPNRASKLYELYKKYNSLDEIPELTRLELEKHIFKASLEQVWRDTEAFWNKRDTTQNLKAENDSKHKMALVFRSYLGLSSKWAIRGEKERVMDYQIWCGPAIASFNEWTKGSFLENYKDRLVVQVGLNLLEGATVLIRAFQLKSYGVTVPAAALNFRPRLLS
jgi:trans-AT polyketide synthase, acyltransferase and oxidoreductase domains